MTFSRTIDHHDREAAISYLTNSGAKVLQVYDYKIYKGVLFESSESADGSSLETLREKLQDFNGVLAIEEDQIVHTKEWSILFSPFFDFRPSFLVPVLSMP